LKTNKKNKFQRLKNKKLKVAVAQMQSVDNVESNVNQMVQLLNSIEKSSMDLIVFPENSLFLRIVKLSAQMGVQSLKEVHWQILQKIVNQKNIHLLLGASLVVKNNRDNSKNGDRKNIKVTIQNKSGAVNSNKSINGIVHLAPMKKPKIVYKKIHLFDVDVKGAPPSRESDIFKHGKKPEIINIKGWKIGLSICYDVRFSELYLKYAKKNVDLILIPAAFLVPTGKAHWHTLVRARAIESQAYVLAPAQGGAHASTLEPHQFRHTFGHSLIIDPWGQILAENTEGEPGLLLAELDLDKRYEVQSQIPMSGHRRLL
jgi:predicted amidohydrolase